MTVEEFVDRLDGQKNYTGGNYQCRCPAHEDRVQSLSVTDGGDKILFYCHAGCDWKDVLKEMGLKPTDLFYHAPYGDPFNEGRALYMQQPEAIYQYKNADGTYAYEVIRFPGKKFRQRRLTGEGFAWNMDGIKKIPYNLPELTIEIAASRRFYQPKRRTCYIPEGEKDVDRLKEEGQLATCFVGGAGKGKFLASYVKYFKDLDVVIIADKDEPGLAYAREIADALTGVAASVKIVQAAVGKDVSDHLDAGKTLDELEEVNA